MKLAGAPITWGVSEVPAWGYRMAPARVLAEMRRLGLTATELGPPGYLPEDVAEMRSVLDAAGLRLAAGFLAVVLHEPGQRQAALAGVDKEAATPSAGPPGSRSPNRSTPPAKSPPSEASSWPSTRTPEPQSKNRRR